MPLGARKTNNSKQIVRSGLVLHLDAARPASYPGSGTTWTDLSGQGNNGTLTNGPTYSSANGGSIVFDGSNDYVTLGSPSFLNTGTVSTARFTLSTWFKTSTSSGVSPGMRLFSCQSINPLFLTRLAFPGTVAAGRAIHLTIRDVDGNTRVWYFPYEFADDKWHNITTVYSEGSVSHYLDGSLRTDVTISGPALNSSSTLNFSNILEIGRYESPNDQFNGRISQCSFYNRALSRAEIKQNYEATKARYPDFSIPVGEG